MARKEMGIFPSKRHDKLDFFLKRHLDESVFNKIRMYEACIVATEGKLKKTFDFVVLTDECIYLTQNPPRTIHEVVHLSDVVAIELIDDYPDFLSGQDRESAQHIRIAYISRMEKKPPKTQGSNNKYIPAHIGGRRKYGSFSHEEVGTKQELSSNADGCNSKPNRPLRKSSLRKSGKCAGEPNPGLSHATSCTAPDLGSLKLSERHEKEPPIPWPSGDRRLPAPPVERPGPVLASKAPVPGETLPLNPHGRGGKDLQCDLCYPTPEAGKRVSDQLKDKEVELHLYIISMSSVIFLHLKSTWNNFMIQSTLMQDPAYARASASCSPARGPKVHSSEGMNKLFNQLSSELLHGSSTLGRTCTLVRDLKTAALWNFTIKKLFWKSNDLYPFLIGKLQEHLPTMEYSRVRRDGSQAKDDLQFCILIVETLGIMFRETETEPTRMALLNTKRGLLVVNLLKILISGPQVAQASPVIGSNGPLQKLLWEYSDAVISALYEIFLITHQLFFIDHMMKRIIKMVLPPFHLMTPTEALLFFQQFYILNTCVQYGSSLAEHVRNKYSEEFRYYIQSTPLEVMLPVHYAVTQPVKRLLHQVIDCILQKPV
ncbi:uncharacterized protein C12orf56 homolog isoform X2 [Narcine bancroftii]|uniref:uncharacterized protein C12orf56 homolog isoform X2 n=1 Tax=Narcine bancroftii TaxID=1343680 RepID=UPI003831370E